MKKNWWKEAVVYQIYPKSFQDSNGDGIGDIPGIITRLDYLKELGINVIWLCPVYKSPMDDGGYDIADYYQVDEMFGSNQDLEELLTKANQLGMKVLMDLVVNHTSDEHAWFQEAIKDPTSPYRDYYVFREGRGGQAPNNWRSYFGDSAWDLVPGEDNLFYLHAFTKKQPDLNWENDNLRQDIYDMINYWLDKGLAGFRIDAILNIKKRIELGDFPADGEDGLTFIGPWILNQPGIEIWLKEMKEKTFIPHDSMTVAEANVPHERLGEYIGEDGFYSMVFDFSYTDIDVPTTGEWFKPSGWTWPLFAEKVFESQVETQKQGWGATYLENHDQPRSLNKYLPAADINNESKKMLATLWMMLRGTPFIYQGEELGMTNNAGMTAISDFDDIATHDQFHRAKLSGMTQTAAFEAVSQRSRDNSRTPMQWENSKNAGFSTADQTWLKVNPNYPEINAASEISDEDSVFRYYQQLIALRKNSIYRDVVIYGEFQPVLTDNSQTIVYLRRLVEKEILIAVNVTNEVQEIVIPEGFNHFILGNYGRENFSAGQLMLKPYESLIIANFGG
ncbi:alpha-glucosidase [Enterococcus sp. HY326]|uniref:alpha-glucosidase n=1 Tax=Enterococcus sp. HY326 TaxID=2971265 RepID=UPI00223EBA4C|nr:alpha-glucosidase [Enterococcus sp. HY326]